MITKVEMTKNVSEDLTATQNVYSTHDKFDAEAPSKESCQKWT